MNTPPVIELRQLVRRYGRTDAVHGLDLTVRAGSCYGFFGRNGAGRRTTIRFPVDDNYNSLVGGRALADWPGGVASRWGRLRAHD